MTSAGLPYSPLPPVVLRDPPSPRSRRSSRSSSATFCTAPPPPAVTADQLKGAVVFVEHWGIHCGPCIGQIAHMAKLQDELADFGLVIVAAHRQKATPDEVRATARTHGINYTVTSGYVSSGERKYSAWLPFSTWTASASLKAARPTPTTSCGPRSGPRWSRSPAGPISTRRSPLRLTPSKPVSRRPWCWSSCCRSPGRRIPRRPPRRRR